MSLTVKPTKVFAHDIKSLTKKHVDLRPLQEVIDLIQQDTTQSKQILRQRHNMHPLRGEQYKNVYDCHVYNSGNLVLLWRREGGYAYMVRVGTHKQVLGK
jgi:mRNA interferase YafQ